MRELLNKVKNPCKLSGEYQATCWEGPSLLAAPRNCSDRRDGRGKEIQAKFLMG